MIHEFALDPLVVNDLQAFKYIVDQCGVHHGRMISQFPRKWKRMAINLCELQGAKRTTITEKLRTIDKKLISLGREYNGDLNWLENAQRQHKNKSFRAIISPNSHDCGGVLIPSEIGEDTAQWAVPREMVVRRDALSLACCAKLLLNISTEILFVDPHFDPPKKRFRETLSYMLEFVFQLKEKGVKRLELHIEYDETKELRRENEWEADCRREITKILPKGSQMKVIRWEKKESGDKLHARYVLTELGGIRYDYGLDEKRFTDETTDVCLIDPSVYKVRWDNYQTETSPFNCHDVLTIEGRK